MDHSYLHKRVLWVLRSQGGKASAEKIGHCLGRYDVVGVLWDLADEGLLRFQRDPWGRGGGQWYLVPQGSPPILRLPPPPEPIQPQPVWYPPIQRPRYSNEKNRRMVEGVALRDGSWCCRYCGAGPFTLADFEAGLAGLDHVVPRSRGGGNGITNRVIACQPCDSAKGDRLVGLVADGSLRLSQPS